jgi:hypothetical protein
MPPKKSSVKTDHSQDVTKASAAAAATGDNNAQVDRLTVLPRDWKKVIGTFLPLRDLMKLRGAHSSLYETQFHQSTQACLVHTSGAMIEALAQERIRLDYLAIHVSWEDLVGMRDTFAQLYRFRKLRALEVTFNLFPGDRAQFAFLNEQEETLAGALGAWTHPQHAPLPNLNTLVLRIHSDAYYVSRALYQPTLLKAMLDLIRRYRDTNTLQHVGFEGIEHCRIKLPERMTEAMSNLVSVRCIECDFHKYDIAQFNQTLRFFRADEFDVSQRHRLLTATLLHGLSFGDVFKLTEPMNYEHLVFFNTLSTHHKDNVQLLSLPLLETWIVRREEYGNFERVMDVVSEQAIGKFPHLRVFWINCVWLTDLNDLAGALNKFDHLQDVHVKLNPPYTSTSPRPEEEGEERKAPEPYRDSQYYMRSFRSKLRHGITAHINEPGEYNESIFADDTFRTPEQLEAAYLLQHGYSTLSPCSNKNIPEETIENRIHVRPGVALASRNR